MRRYATYPKVSYGMVGRRSVALGSVAPRAAKYGIAAFGTAWQGKDFLNDFPAKRGPALCGVAISRPARLSAAKRREARIFCV